MADSKLDDPVRGHGRYLFALEHDPPRSGTENAADRAQKGALPRAVGTDDRDDLPLLHARAHLVQSVDGAVVDVDGLDLEHVGLGSTQKGPAWSAGRFGSLLITGYLRRRRRSAT